jgi:hypothetical protein
MIRIPVMMLLKNDPIIEPGRKPCGGAPCPGISSGRIPVWIMISRIVTIIMESTTIRIYCLRLLLNSNRGTRKYRLSRNNRKKNEILIQSAIILEKFNPFTSCIFLK